MPELAALRIPPSVQQGIVAQYALGTSKRKIAKAFGIDRATVDRTLALGQMVQPNAATDTAIASQQPSHIQPLIRDAYTTLSQALTSESVKLIDRANLSMRLLEATDLQPQRAPSLAVNIERFASISQLMPSDAGGPKQPQSPCDELGRISCPTDFFQALSKQPSKQPITLICNGETLQIMRCSGGGEPTPAARVIEVPSLPSPDEQGNAEK